MKNILLTTLICLLLTSTSFAYTYDSKFDPAIFYEWERRGERICPAKHYHFAAINPDENSDMKIVETLNFIIEGRVYMGGYKYFKDDIEYMFIFDPSKNHYEQMKPEKGGDKSTAML